jgi:MYXO-CTERM domain-containing protein
LTGRSDDATAMRDESMGLETEVTGYTDEYVVSDGQTQMQMSGGEFDATPVDYSDGASTKSPILLYAGLGGGALLLLLLLRRRKR